MEADVNFVLEAARTERLLRELHALANHAGVSLILSPSGYLNTFFIVVRASKGPYAQHDLTFIVDLPWKWPQMPPKFRCHDRSVFHPNISADGHVCLNLLRNDYEPSFTLLTLVLAIVCLIEEPSIEEPLNLEAARAIENGEWESIVLSRLQRHQK